MTADPFSVVKECKGVALAILVLLSLNARHGGGAVTQEWLERHSGYTDKPVSQALVYLRETGRILETAAGYILAGPSDALPGLSGSPGSLPAERRGDCMAQAATQERMRPPAASSAVQASQVTETARQGALSRKISDSATSTAALNTESLQEEAEEEGGVGVFPTPETLQHVEANLAAFKKWGIGRNEKTIQVAARQEVTPGQIEAIACQLIAERRFSTGLLITAVQSGDQPVTDLPNKYRPRGGSRDPSGYANWEE